MSSKNSMSTDKILNEIQNEYMKFMNISKKKFSNDKNDQSSSITTTTTTTTTTQLVETPSGSDGTIIGSHHAEEKSKSKFAVFKQSFTEQVSKFNTKNVPEQFQVIKTTFTESIQKIPESESFKNLQGILNDPKKFTLPTIWKTPEPLKRPEGLQLSLIGVALFKGNEMISKAIRKLTKSRYSHVALLMHDVTKDKNDPSGWYIYSANGSASQIFDDHRFPQVQLEKWSDVVETYDGAAGVRMIMFNAEDACPDCNIITELVDKYLGLPYETQLLVMLKAMNRKNVEAEDHAKSAFCSEICYRFLVSCGVIEDTEIPENVWPKDFSDENDKIPLKNGTWADLVVHRGRFIKLANEESLDRQDSVIRQESVGRQESVINPPSTIVVSSLSFTG